MVNNVTRKKRRIRKTDIDVSPPLFEWKRDRNGYDLDDAGSVPRIIRRGGDWETYCPDTCDPLPHVIFADLNCQILGAEEELPPPHKRIKGEPLWARRFPDLQAALLAFVNEFGFLGSLETGAEGRNGSEAVEYLEKQQTSLSVYYAFGGNNPVMFNNRATARQRLYPYLNKDGEITETYLPLTFLDWIWIRSWQTRKYHCQHCGKHMGLGKGFKRIVSEFCSVSCRVLHQKMLSGNT